MSKINYYDVEAIRNINEKRVWDMLPFFLERNPHLCTCGNCVLDIVAIALNNLKPVYQVYEESVDLARDKVSDEEIYRQLTNGARIVHENPRHS
ncbi:late competence development ComFB family protein [Limisalsivibrio acetivorans]|uniref:late competence development ComFB family protein n=1 Tax=Limisalsivibrio acetivorans TaxID=1304888 RepID=UPI0003B382CB|nr:late competence development ComFB family protein [Limisalsivibrio acetivorans]